MSATSKTLTASLIICRFLVDEIAIQLYRLHDITNTDSTSKGQKYYKLPRVVDKAKMEAMRVRPRTVSCVRGCPVLGEILQFRNVWAISKVCASLRDLQRTRSTTTQKTPMSGWYWYIFNSFNEKATWKQEGGWVSPSVQVVRCGMHDSRNRKSMAFYHRTVLARCVQKGTTHITLRTPCIKQTLIYHKFIFRSSSNKLTEFSKTKCRIIFDTLLSFIYNG